jgi:Ca2+/Na+ antiporter
MFDFNLILKIIISAVVLYLVVNSIFRYHIYNDLVISLLVFCYLVVLIIYSDLAYSHLFSILLGSLTVLFMAVYTFLRVKKIQYYWILNGNKTTYHRINYYLKLNNESGVLYNYDKRFFWVIKFYDSDYLEVKKIMKGIEAQETKRNKRFTICNYWQIVIFLVMMVILWRF